MATLTTRRAPVPVTADPNVSESATSARRPGRPRDVRCDQAILEATRDMLVEGGAANLSIDGVAARAGVGKATIYRRWASKESLVLDAINNDTSLIVVADTGALRSDLDAYFDAVLLKLEANRGTDVLPHLIEAGCYDTEIRASLDDYMRSRQEPLRALLKRAQKRGELAAHIDIAVMSDVLIGPAMYRRLLTGGRIDRAFIRKLLDIVL